MEGSIILKGVGLLIGGLLFAWLGVSGWKLRREERLSIVEAAILKLGDADPLPRNRWDRGMACAQPVLMLIFGPVMIFLGLVILFV